MPGLILPHSAAAMYRASGAFDPVSDLPNLVGIWDAGDESSISDTGGQVTQINDLSAAGNNLSCSASSSLQTGVAADDINSRNVLSFGSNKSIQNTTAPMVFDNYEMMFLVQPDNVTNRYIFGTGGTTSGHVIINVSGTISNTLYTDSGAQTISGPTISIDEVCIVHVYVDGTTGYAGKNGVGSTGTVSGTKAGTSQNLILGARLIDHSFAFDGGVAYAAITDTPWSLSDKNALGSYLATLGGISWTTMT